jgi:phage gp37-like protein
MEDALIALLSAGLPDTVQVDSLPLGMNDRKALDVRLAAVWVVYAGSANKPNMSAGALNQPETRTWSCMVLAKKYRSSRDAGDAALDLLEQVVGVLAGAMIDGARVAKVRDQIMRLEEGKGIVGYEAVFSLQTYLRRTS